MIDDEFSGQGGTYLLDPATGKRTLLKRTTPASAPQPAAPVDVQTSPAPVLPLPSTLADEPTD